MDNQAGDQIRSMVNIKTRSAVNINDGFMTSMVEDKNESSVLLPEATKSVSAFAQTLDLKIKKLKRSMEGWREIVLSTQSVLLWEKQWHPAAIFGTSTIIFIFLWMLDPAILTTISVLGLIVTISDYLVPTLVTGLFRTNNWTGAHEKKYDELCRTLVLYYTHTSTMLASFYLMRTIRPKVYYTILIISLVLLAWLGSTINNLLLTYITVTWLLLIPGLEHKGLLCKYTECLTVKFKEVLKVQANTKNE